jgi:hypothetical protein
LKVWKEKCEKEVEGLIDLYLNLKII